MCSTSPSGPFDHDGRLGQRRLVFLALLVDDAEADEPEAARLLAVEALLHQQLERRLGALELEAAVLQLLHLGEHAAHRRLELLDVDAELLRLVEDVAAPGQVRHQDALAVADHRRIDVLVGERVLLHRGDVNAALVREGAQADVRPGACWARRSPAPRRSATARAGGAAAPG